MKHYYHPEALKMAADVEAAGAEDVDHLREIQRKCNPLRMQGEPSN